MRYDYTLLKGGERRGVIYEHTYVPGIVGYAFRHERRSSLHKNTPVLGRVGIAANLL